MQYCGITLKMSVTHPVDMISFAAVVVVLAVLCLVPCQVLVLQEVSQLVECRRYMNEQSNMSRSLSVKVEFLSHCHSVLI